jgi:hypothetical protein
MTIGAVSLSVEGIANRGEETAAIQFQGQGELMNAGTMKVLKSFRSPHRSAFWATTRTIPKCRSSRGGTPTPRKRSGRPPTKVKEMIRIQCRAARRQEGLHPTEFQQSQVG